MPAVAQLSAANKIYQVGDTTITALDKTDLTVNAGEVLLIIGPSGSGKTTLLSLLGCVLYPTSGTVAVNGREISGLSDKMLAEIRLANIGFVFQSFNLIAPFNALDNVSFPLTLTGKFSAAEIKAKSLAALEKVGMLDRQKNLPRQLSGGQQQRVAIARALVTDPLMLLCDEPTAALDIKSVDSVMAELKGLARQGKAVIIVTHDHRLEAYADRVVQVDDGRVTQVR